MSAEPTTPNRKRAKESPEKKRRRDEQKEEFRGRLSAQSTVLDDEPIAVSEQRGVDVDRARELGALDAESLRKQSIVERKMKSIADGVDQRNVSWEDVDDPVKFEAVTEAWGATSGNWRVHLTRTRPDPGAPVTIDLAKLSATPDWEKFRQYVEETYWDGRAMEFHWTLVQKAAYRVAGDLKFPVDEAQQRRWRMKLRDLEEEEAAQELERERRRHEQATAVARARREAEEEARAAVAAANAPPPRAPAAVPEPMPASMPAWVAHAQAMGWSPPAHQQPTQAPIPQDPSLLFKDADARMQWMFGETQKVRDTTKELQASNERSVERLGELTTRLTEMTSFLKGFSETVSGGMGSLKSALEKVAESHVAHTKYTDEKLNDLRTRAAPREEAGSMVNGFDGELEAHLRRQEQLRKAGVAAGMVPRDEAEKLAEERAARVAAAQPEPRQKYRDEDNWADAPHWRFRKDPETGKIYDDFGLATFAMNVDHIKDFVGDMFDRKDKNEEKAVEREKQSLETREKQLKQNQAEIEQRRAALEIEERQLALAERAANFRAQQAHDPRASGQQTNGHAHPAAEGEHTNGHAAPNGHATQAPPEDDDEASFMEAFGHHRR